jgi:hypothetical protein
MVEPRIEIDLHLLDAASVFARGKTDSVSGPQLESFRRRLLQFVAEYDALTSDAPAARFLKGRGNQELDTSADVGS